MPGSRDLTIIFCVFLFVAAVADAQAIDTLDFDGEYTDQAIPATNWYKVWDIFVQDDTVSGYFETHAETQGLDFFICDQANLVLWEGGYSATVYNSEDDMHTLGFTFTIPYADTWYCVFSNYDGISTVTVDIGVDKNGDNTPYFSPSSYDITRYGEILENNEFYHITNTYYAGTEIDGSYETWFPTDGVDFFICDDANYNLWYGGSTAQVYSQEIDMHVANLDAFIIPTTGVWHIIFSATDEVDTVTLSFGLTVDTSGAIITTGDGGNLAPLLIIIGLGAFAVLLLLGYLLTRKRKGDTGIPPIEHVVIPPSSPSTPESHGAVREKEILTRVLVVCPFCGAKNEQGVLRCHNCSAEL